MERRLANNRPVRKPEITGSDVRGVSGSKNRVTPVLDSVNARAVGVGGRRKTNLQCRATQYPISFEKTLTVSNRRSNRAIEQNRYVSACVSAAARRQTTNRTGMKGRESVLNRTHTKTTSHNVNRFSYPYTGPRGK